MSSDHFNPEENFFVRCYPKKFLGILQLCFIKLVHDLSDSHVMLVIYALDGNFDLVLKCIKFQNFAICRRFSAFVGPQVICRLCFSNEIAGVQHSGFQLFYMQGGI